VNDELLELAVRVASAAAERALAWRTDGVTITGLKSTPTDVVTMADQQTEAYLREEIIRARPLDGLLGEEHDSVPSQSGLTWVIDPIDGTVNYLYGIPAWAVSVAVVEGDPDPAHWRTVAACVVNPAAAETYAGSAGAGSTLNGRPLRLEPKTDLATALVATGFGYAAAKRASQAEMLTRLIGQVRDVRRIGAASLDLCGVATGRLDAYYESGLNAWDHAGGALIAREAGAVVGGLAAGTPETADMTVAVNPGLADGFRQLLRGSGLG
jgi:myo-inositol-1(or 4)-monophosphatase